MQTSYPEVAEPVVAEPELAQPDWAEPDWAEPRYADLLDDAERLALERVRGPGGRDCRWLTAVAPADLKSDDRLELLTILDEQVRWLQAALVRTLAAVEAADGSAKKYAQEAVSLALRIPVRTAQNRLRQATTLVHELPATLDFLAAGRVSHDQARTLTDAVWRLPSARPELVGQLEQLVLGRAPLQTNAQFRAAVRQAAIRVDPASAEERHQRARSDRCVRLEPAEDGMVSLPVVLDAPDGQLIYTRLTAAATAVPSTDERTMDQRRADILVAAVLTGLPTDELPVMQGRKPTVQVVVSADTLLELDDEPGQLLGYGPITAETARRLAADESGTWRRLLTDPNTGDLLDLGAETYRPSARLRAFVQARDGVCAFPTCNQPGYRCEFEHIVEFLDGGRTCRCNGALACRRHNQCKIDSQWSYVRNADGSFTWTAPGGHRYSSAPARAWLELSDRLAPPAPPRVRTLAEVRAAEDARYRKLVDRWRSERVAAEQAGDKHRAEQAKAALAGIGRQRRWDLAHRKNPSVPPY